MIENHASAKTTQARNAFQAITIYFIAALIALLVELYLALQHQAWQLFVIVGIGTLLAGLAGVSLALVRRGHLYFGLRLLIGAALISILVTPFFIANLGLILGLGTVVVIVIIISPMLPSQEVNRILILGLGIAAIAGGLDLLPLSSPLTLPPFQTFISILGIGTILTYKLLTPQPPTPNPPSPPPIPAHWHELVTGLEAQVTKRTVELTRANEQLLREIVEHEWTEEALRASEQRFRQVISSVSDHIYMTEFTAERDQINRYISPNIEALTGYPAEKFIADWRFWQSLIHPDHKAATAAQAARFAKGKNSELEYRLIRADGETIWVRDSGRVEKDPEHQSITVYGVVSNITERKQTEEALRRSEQRFRQVISSISDHIYMTEFTAVGKQINRYISPNIEALTGHPVEKFIPDWRFWQWLIHPDDRATAAAQVARFAQGQNSEVEYRLIRADGQMIWVRDSGQVEKDPEQQNITVYGVVSNITERKQAEEALRRSEEKFRIMAENIPGVIYLRHHDERYTMLYLNDAVETLTGYPKADFLEGKISFVDLFYPDDASVIALQIKQALSERHSFYLTYRFKHRSGQWRWIEEFGIGVFDDDQLLFLEGFLSDITKRKQAEDALALAHDQALEANRLKSQLLANVSHDLRTPLNAILGYAEMLQEGVYGPLSNQQGNITKKIIGSTVNLTALVNQLLDQAQLEARTLKLTVTPFAPADLVDHVQSTMSVLAESKGLALSSEIAPDVPLTLSGDPARLQQILTNLVGNAIKFTEHGTVCVRIYCPDTAHWAMQVSDTGPGIAAQDQSYIFDAFRQVDGTVTRKHGGAGLGLSIVKQLVTLMTGQVTLDSKPGQGCTFTILLPLTQITTNDERQT